MRDETDSQSPTPYAWRAGAAASGQSPRHTLAAATPAGDTFGRPRQRQVTSQVVPAAFHGGGGHGGGFHGGGFHGGYGGFHGDRGGWGWPWGWDRRWSCGR